MRSRKSQRTLSSGSSERSTKKRAASRQNENSLPTAPASFDQVFGKADSPELAKTRQQLQEARERLRGHDLIPIPSLALLRQRHLQRRAWLERHVRNLQEYLDTLKGD